MTFVTDLNHRERQRYAQVAEAIADAARQLARALRDANDSDALTHLLRLALAHHQLAELAPIFQDATNVDIPDHPPATTP